MLNTQIVHLKRQGKENVKHKSAIEDEDLKKLKTSQAIALTSPLTLLQNVWFHVVLFFCRRGREGQRELKRSSFKFEADASGRKFVTMAHDEATKNHPGGLSDVSSHENLARMYETPEENDGYKAMKIYLEKLTPKCDAFFQYPKEHWKYDDEIKLDTDWSCIIPNWYDARPICVNKLDGMMEDINRAAELSKAYTNHSVRATAITLWSNAAVQNRHIMAISGHRSEQSLAHYNTRPSTSQLQQCSDVLSRSLNAENSFFSCNPINDRTQIQEHSAMTTGTSNSFLGSLFNNCTVQQAHVHVTLGSDFSRGC